MNGEPASRKPSCSPGPWRVLLVTDSLVDQRLLAGLLNKHRHRVFTAGTGREALLEWSENQFDVVLIDAMLPEMDGAELVRNIRHQEESSQHNAVPIIILSEDEADRDLCCRAGANACLTRPMQISEFHACVVETQRSGEVSDREDSDAGEPSRDRIDWQVALDAVGGRRDLLAELVQIFCDEYPMTLATIREAIERSDPKLLQLSAHQLKGCLRYFGPTTASEMAHSLEEIGRSGRIDGAATRIEPLSAAVKRLLPKLQEGPA